MFAQAMELQPLVNSIVQATGMSGVCAGMFWLVIYLLKFHRQEVWAIRKAHFLEIVQLRVTWETYNQVILDRLGMSQAEREELRREAVRRIDEAIKQYPKQPGEIAKDDEE